MFEIRRRSTLTKQQQREAEAALYGLSSRSHMENQQFSHEEIQRMKQIVSQHESAEMPKEFDLNNPPKIPYKHQEFPKMLYHHARGKHIIVENKEQLETLLDGGWSLKPPSQAPLPEETGEDLDPETTAEIAEIDSKLKKAEKPKR